MTRSVWASAWQAAPVRPTSSWCPVLSPVRLVTGSSVPSLSVGSCPRSGNVFKGSYAIDGPLEKWVHVDVSVAGCTPKPEAIMAGLAKATEILKEKRKEMRK